MEDIKRAKVDTSFLKNETIIVRFLPRPTKEIRDPKHIAYGGKLEDCFDYIAPPRLRKDKLKNVLTKQEKEGLEYLMNTDLSVYSDFWKGYKKGGLFPIALGKRDMYLDLSTPEHYIIWKVLLANESLIANSLEDVRKRGSYKYVLVKEKDTEKVESERVNLKEEAYSLFGEIKKSKNAMRYILRQFGKHTHAGQTEVFLRGEIGKIIEDKTQLFVKYASDEQLEVKVLVQEALELGVLRKSGKEYFTIDGKTLADEGLESTMENSVVHLSSPLGQELRFEIEAKVKNARD